MGVAQFYPVLKMSIEVIGDPHKKNIYITRGTMYHDIYIHTACNDVFIYVEMFRYLNIRTAFDIPHSYWSSDVHPATKIIIT